MVGLCLFSQYRRCIVGKKLYCGNLSYNVSNSDLDQIFGEFGTVQSAEVIMDRDTGRSKGFGFVEMGSDEEAQAAIAGVNGKEHDGRTLTVNEARPREERRGGGGGGGGRGGTAVVAAAVVAAATVAAVVVAADAVTKLRTESVQSDFGLMTFVHCRAMARQCLFVGLAFGQR